MFLKLKRVLSSTNFFWKYRHLLHKDIFDDKYGIVPTLHFNKIFKNIKINNVLDFGCATGDKLIYFINNNAKFVYGIDINDKAIKTAKNKISKLKVYSEFSNKIYLEKITLFLKKIKKKKFDLVIFDRTLYILKDLEFYYALKVLSKIAKYIYIDDFFHNFRLYNNDTIVRNDYCSGYLHSNFNLIFFKTSFKRCFYGKSPYKKVLFANSKSALYKKI